MSNMIFVQLTIFILLALAVLFGAHYFLYFSIIRFFVITNAFLKSALFILISFLSISFILSMILARWQENILTRTFYFLSGFWLGLLTNLIIAGAVMWLIVWISRLAGFNVNTVVLGVVFFVAALGVSAYGAWNSFNPRIKNITVNIPDLPEQWKNKKIVQLSDVHLGIIYQENFMKSVVKEVNKISPEMVVVTGDLFDGTDGDLNSLISPLNDIKAEKGVFFITGNHETYLGVEKVFGVLQKTKINILRDQVVDVGGLRLVGIDYPEMGKPQDLAAKLDSLKKDFYGKPNVLLYHSPANIDLFMRSGVNLQLSGHTHEGQIFPFGYITKLIYGSYDYGLHRIGDYTIYTTTGVGTWGPPMRIGNTPEIVVITLN